MVSETEWSRKMSLKIGLKSGTSWSWVKFCYFGDTVVARDGAVDSSF